MHNKRIHFSVDGSGSDLRILRQRTFLEEMKTFTEPFFVGGLIGCTYLSEYWPVLVWVKSSSLGLLVSTIPLSRLFGISSKSLKSFESLESLEISSGSESHQNPQNHIKS